VPNNLTAAEHGQPFFRHKNIFSQANPNRSFPFFLATIAGMMRGHEIET